MWKIFNNAKALCSRFFLEKSETEFTISTTPDEAIIRRFQNEWDELLNASRIAHPDEPPSNQQRYAVQNMAQNLLSGHLAMLGSSFVFMEAENIERYAPEAKGILAEIGRHYLPELESYFNRLPSEDASLPDMRILSRYLATSFEAGTDEEDKAVFLWGQLNRRLNTYIPGAGMGEAQFVVNHTPHDRLLHRVALTLAQP